ncbi:hypothetical protein GCM10010358_40450 [Streptomyces minutiscleroticus]|uniref:Uncharacterized protein n=1 Tax=Streptomyces minutiscleroticus TaxID=68238 RepID=A0A918U2D7_9ACTN|nr:hypothetical protein GCM10010358_40450 [Streptomyces minutiscleroticus]
MTDAARGTGTAAAPAEVRDGAVAAVRAGTATDQAGTDQAGTAPAGTAPADMAPADMAPADMGPAADTATRTVTARPPPSPAICARSSRRC